MNRIKLGLCLSGGGARGIAHVGILKALEENEIVVDVISGTSAGSIVGAMHASGCTIDQMMEVLKQSSFFKILRFGIPTDGLVKLTYLRQVLEDYIKEDDFAALQKPLFIAVSNLNSGDAEYISSGPLFDVVLASSSIPWIFKPIEMGGNLYVDGGLLDNLPVKPLLQQVDLLVGVNVMHKVDTDKKSVQNLMGITNRVFEMSIWANTKPNVGFFDVLIEPDVHSFSIFQLNKYKELFEIGYQAGLKAVPVIKEKLLLAAAV